MTEQAICGSLHVFVVVGGTVKDAISIPKQRNSLLAKIVPELGIQDVCQHQVQARPNLCSVRLAGCICASALEYIGIGVKEHPLAPLAFNNEWM